MASGRHRPAPVADKPEPLAVLLDKNAPIRRAAEFMTSGTRLPPGLWNDRPVPGTKDPE